MAAVVLIVVVYILANTAEVWFYASKDETRDADAAIVLGAAAYESGPSPVYRERLNHAVLLYNEGYVSTIILTGGYGKGNKVSDAEIGARYVASLGVPEDDILLEKRSTVTRENLENAAEIMDRKGLSSALIVSDPLHMRRAMLLARDAGITAFTSPTRTSRYQSDDTKFDFLRREVVYFIGYKWYRIFN